MDSVLKTLPAGEANKFKQIISLFDGKKYKKGHNKLLKLMEKDSKRAGKLRRISFYEGVVGV